MMQYKSSKFEIKAISENMFEGYASHFNNVDSYGDVIQKGAFTKTLQDNKNRIKILWQHDTSEPIGLPVKMMEDDNGLFVEGKISMTETGKKAMTLMRDGVITEMSIGYDVIKDDYKDNKRILKELRLWEFSLVSFGANDKAKITGAKSFDELMYELKHSKKDDIIYIIDKLNTYLKSFEPANTTQNEKDPNEVQSILQMIRGFKNADT
jgi:HK97 family phage prohead protease